MLQQAYPTWDRKKDEADCDNKGWTELPCNRPRCGLLNETHSSSSEVTPTRTVQVMYLSRRKYDTVEQTLSRGGLFALFRMSWDATSLGWMLVPVERLR